MFKKLFKTIINIVPLALMVGLIPFVSNDYLLLSFYAIIIFVAFAIKRERMEMKLFFIGLFVMMGCEYLFTSTGVEVFKRDSLFGLMPVWLPVLWGYGFVVIKRFIKIFNF